MLTWILVTALALLGGGWFAARAARKAAQVGRALPAGSDGHAQLERTLRDVRPMDVVQHHGHDYLVEGVIQYDEDGHTWRCARIMEGSKEKWLLVGLERQGPMTVRLLDIVSPFELSGYPPETLEQAGVSYKLDKRGTATVTTQGDLDKLPAAAEAGAVRCRWWKYLAAGEKCLLVEQWGETYRAMVGETLRADDVDLLGAS